MTPNPNKQVLGYVPVGPSTEDVELAKRRCLRHGGYVVDASRKLVAQTMRPQGPKYIKQNIASGEDVCPT